MGNKQRDRFWPIFQSTLRQIADRGLLTEAGIFRAVTQHYKDRTEKPFSSIVVDEAQDLGVPVLRFLVSIAPAGPDALFFTGDLGQRIFQQPFSWKSLGVNVQGRSVTLRVNYRTSHQVREAADRLLPGPVSDADGEKDDRRGTISVFNGPEPVVVLADTADAEQGAIADFIRGALNDGINAEEIAVFVRTREIIGRAREAVKAAGCTPFELTMHKEGLVDVVSRRCRRALANTSSRVVVAVGRGRVIDPRGRHAVAVVPRVRRPLFARYDAVALSHIEASQSGVAAVAFGNGMPAVGMPTGGVAEQVVEGQTGILAHRTSARALADAIHRMNADTELYERLSKAIGATAEQRSMAHFANQITAAIGSLQ